MIDSEFIIKYTNGLYASGKDNSPSYDEFRDMFSSGQIASKEWVINVLESLNFISNQCILIAGAWYGTLGLMLRKKFPNINITLLDIDPRCEVFLKNITYDDRKISVITKDMYKYNYTEDIVVNTACEHIPNVRDWLNTIPKNTIVILQSNNFLKGSGHINCVNNIDQFLEQTSLLEILYSGELVTNMYTRYMIIGKT